MPMFEVCHKPASGVVALALARRANRGSFDGLDFKGVLSDCELVISTSRTPQE